MASLSEIERMGFLSEDIKKFLASHDIHINGEQEPEAQPEAPPKQEEKPLETRERNTLLAIIAVLCNDAKIDYTKPSKAADYIQSTADKMGLSIGETTIKGHLKKITDAVATRMK